MGDNCPLFIGLHPTRQGHGQADLKESVGVGLDWGLNRLCLQQGPTPCEQLSPRAECCGPGLSCVQVSARGLLQRKCREDFMSTYRK